MSLLDPVIHLAGRVLMDMPAQRRSLDDLTAQLQADAATVTARFSSAKHEKQNHSVMTHIIGIEKWGQSRLSALLDDAAAPPMDEYDAYRPARETEFSDLVMQFQSTRADTVMLARQIAAQGMGDASIPHNFYGTLTVRGWLRYLNLHANFESKKLR